jgi:Tfp pilus assembly protein PilN
MLNIMLKLGGHMTTSTLTKEAKVLNALQEGRTLSSAQMKAFFSVGNPQAVVQSLRFKGYPIYLNVVTDTKNRSRNVYRLGTPSRAIIAAGYKALASS